jgi:molecular chaperone DnaJ
MSQKRDCYEILGLERSASADEIKSAYRKAALKWHPDRKPQKKQEAEEKFREATESYSILYDAQKRATYDRFGYAGL